MHLMTSDINSVNTSDELLQAYTALFLFLGGSVSMNPYESGLPHLCDAGLLRNLPVESRNSRFGQASRLLKSPCPFKLECNHTVTQNYGALLSGNSESGAFPAASNWRNSGTTAEEHHRSLNQVYSRYGYNKSGDDGLAPDHLGIELLFANLMIEKYLTEDDYEIREMIRRDLLDFISTEMLSWLPRWAEQVSVKSVTKCYTGISGLIIGGLEDVKEILSRQKLGL
jgi:TorA maturation chaperone TorD